MNYVLISSWHIIRLTTRGGGKTTLCGRMTGPDAKTADSFGDEASCEVCLRIAAKRGLGGNG